MITWDRGRALVESQIYGRVRRSSRFCVSCRPCRRCGPGKAVYLAASTAVLPSALRRNLRHNRALHEEVAILTLLTEDISAVSRDDKVEVEPLAAGFYRVVAHVGFVEAPDVPYALALAHEKGLPSELEEAVAFSAGNACCRRGDPPCRAGAVGSSCPCRAMRSAFPITFGFHPTRSWRRARQIQI